MAPPGEAKKSIVGKLFGGIQTKIDRIVNGTFQRHFCESRRTEPTHCRRLIMIECTYDFPITTEEFLLQISNWFDPHHGSLASRLQKKMSGLGLRRDHSDGKRVSFRMFFLFGENIPIEYDMKRGAPEKLERVLAWKFPLSKVSVAKREVITCDVVRDVFNSHLTLHENRCRDGTWVHKDGTSVPALQVATSSFDDWKAHRETLDWRAVYGVGTY
ncbi:hypothetical protein CORC01_08461 [Colletotrichum orchidophilum]|uniref:Uncharacterized protein n=1 Tax=Colletotrichum orchidophilum TaxID=1209926 RepID=A0A1G4B4J2_9PEZI|nr:uncharacterized protein CORC01_08461 [Colletotrichum orchidophilum]OHE96243.1 hypothetical protein CORC01_08461 [Colletotrichum orchidophilum]